MASRNYLYVGTGIAKATPDYFMSFDGIFEWAGSQNAVALELTQAGTLDLRYKAMPTGGAVVYGSNFGNIVFTTEARDVVWAGDGADQIFGGGGHDQLSGGNGHDLIEGGNGDDAIEGGAGDDHLYGGGGDDFISDLEGHVHISGDWGNDRIFINQRSPTGSIDGGLDRDTLIADYVDLSGLSISNVEVLAIERSVKGTVKQFADFKVITVNTMAGEDVAAPIHMTITDSGYVDLSSQLGEKRWLNLTTSEFGNHVVGGVLGDEMTGGAGADELHGGKGDDRLEGGGNADRLFGEEGNDSLFGGEGADLLDGGEGDDLLDGGLGNDTFVTGDGNDEIWGDGQGQYDPGSRDTVVLKGSYASYSMASPVHGTTLIFGPDGIKTLRDVELVRFADGVLDLGTDVFTPTTPGVTVTGTSGNDILSPTRAPAGQPRPGIGNDTLHGLGGNDTLDGGAGADAMHGGAGNDTYVVDSTRDTAIETLADGTDAGGIDTVKASATFTLGDFVENLTLTGSADIDGTGNGLANVIRGNAGTNYLSGEGGDDALFGHGGVDALLGGEGRDRLYGGDDTDYLSGGDGDDRLYGEAGADELNGDDGDDYLSGGAGDDRLLGGAGNDRLDGGTGADTMTGMWGDDIYVVDHADDLVFEELEADYDGGGMDKVYASVSFTLGRYVEDLVLTGTGAIDGTGNEGANRLTGNAAANRLEGGLGADILKAGAGDDILVGGEGRDILYGGTGADLFVVGRTMPGETDQFCDFRASEGDRVGFDPADFGLTVGGGLDADGALEAGWFAVVSGRGAQGTEAGHGQFLYNTTTRILSWDEDGAGSGTSEWLASFNSGVLLTASDLQLFG